MRVHYLNLNFSLGVFVQLRAMLLFDIARHSVN